jgi:hypothetical protein
MAGDIIYTLTADEVWRLKRLLEAFEYGRLTQQSSDPPRAKPKAIQVYLAKATGTISAVATTTITRTGTTASGSYQVTALSQPSDLALGMAVSGTGIGAGTVINSIDSASQVTLSIAATASGSPSLTFTVDVLGSGPIEIYGLFSRVDGAYSAWDQSIPDTVYNASTGTFASGTYLRPFRDPTTGLLICESAGTSDHKVMVSADDTTPDYLENKLTGGSGIIVTETIEAGDETMTIAATSGVGPKVLFDHYADAGNVGTGQTDLYSDTVAAGQLANNGEMLQAIYRLGGVSNTATVTVSWAGNTIATANVVMPNVLRIAVEIIRASSGITRNTVSIEIDGVASFVRSTNLGFNPSTTNILKITGQDADGDNTVVASAGKIIWWPAAS